MAPSTTHPSSAEEELLRRILARDVPDDEAITELHARREGFLAKKTLTHGQREGGRLIFYKAIESSLPLALKAGTPVVRVLESVMIQIAALGIELPGSCEDPDASAVLLTPSPIVPRPPVSPISPLAPTGLGLQGGTSGTSGPPITLTPAPRQPPSMVTSSTALTDPAHSSIKKLRPMRPESDVREPSRMSARQQAQKAAKDRAEQERSDKALMPSSAPPQPLPGPTGSRLGSDAQTKPKVKPSKTSDARVSPGSKHSPRSFHSKTKASANPEQELVAAKQSLIVKLPACSTPGNTTADMPSRGSGAAPRPKPPRGPGKAQQSKADAQQVRDKQNIAVPPTKMGPTLRLTLSAPQQQPTPDPSVPATDDDDWESTSEPTPTAPVFPPFPPLRAREVERFVTGGEIAVENILEGHEENPKHTLAELIQELEENKPTVDDWARLAVMKGNEYVYGALKVPGCEELGVERACAMLRDHAVKQYELLMKASGKGGKPGTKG